MAPARRLSSTRSPRVVALRALHQAEGRRATGRFLVEGPKLVNEALAAGVEPDEVLVSPRLGVDSLVTRLQRLGVRISEVEDRVLDAVCAADSHQGIVAAMPLPSPLGATLPRAADQSLLLVGCGIQDPGNLGALIRVAEAFGAAAFLAVGGADPWSPKVVRASAGSLFRLRVGRHEQAAVLLEALAHAGYRLAAAVPRGGQRPSPELGRKPLALWVGGEGAGLPAAIESACPLALTVPLRAPVESLNVAVAAGVLLYALSEPEPAASGSSRREA